MAHRRNTAGFPAIQVPLRHERRRILPAIACLFVWAGEAAADFEDGWIAYVDGDYATAYAEWLPLAQHGHAASQLNLGVMFDKGQGVPEDHAKAVEWFRRAAELDNQLAQYNLGVMYREGRGVEEDDLEAVKWFIKAADQGENFGEFALALAYLNGEGVEQDIDEGLQWLKLAVEHGNSAAMFEYGRLLETGQLVSQDVSASLDLFHQAAEAGSAAARFGLVKSILRAAASRRILCWHGCGSIWQATAVTSKPDWPPKYCGSH